MHFAPHLCFSSLFFKLGIIFAIDILKSDSMKKYILFLFLSTNVLLANNSDFSIIFDKHYENNLVSITQNYNRTLTTLGLTRNFNSNNTYAQSYTNPFEYLASQSNKYGNELHLLQTDLDGNIQKDITIALGMFATPAALIKTPSDGYILGGSTAHGSFLVLKLSPDAKIEFQKEISNPNKDTMSTLVALEDGGILIVGTTNISRKTYGDIFDGGVGGHDISLIRLSKNAEIVWNKKFGSPDHDSGIDAVELSDGSFIVLGDSKTKDLFTTLILKVSENGDTIWSEKIESKTMLIPKKLLNLKNQSVLVSLVEKDDVSKEQIRLLIIDSQKNILNDKQITTTYPSQLNDIALFANGDIFGVGSVRDTQNTDALIMRLDRNLKLICQDHFGDASYDSFDSLALLHNSQIAAVGKHTTQGEESNMWLMKFNDDCSVASRNKSAISLHKELSDIFSKEINEHAITISKDMFLSIEESALYFDVAEFNLKKNQKQFLDTLNQKLIPFIKKYHTIIESVEINGHTSSEWSGVDFATNYLNNAELSLKRSFSVLSYIFKSQDKKTQEILVKLLRGSGSSYKNKKMIEKIEDKEKSRRVTFKIILKK